MDLWFCWTGHVVRFAAVATFCVPQWRCLAAGGQRGTDAHVFYAVALERGSRAARALAEQHGLRFISRIGNLEGHYTLRASESTITTTLEHTLTQHAGVKWLQRQQAHYRDERAAIPGVRNSNQYKFIGQKQSGRGFGTEPPDSLHFNDPLWPMQWELFNYGQVGSSLLDINVMPVWLRNITGNGVVVCIIDDGVDHSNLDLKKNFEVFASFDLRGAHGLSHDPMPLRDEENGHGTKCAGEIAMEANNCYCGVGIAFNARVGGIRLLDGSLTDSMEASALTYNNDFIDIYTCCWGPRDDGTELTGPAMLTEKALRLGTHKGRGGKGSIFVWASGNCGMPNDHCGADGYVNSIYTIAIGTISHTYGFGLLDAAVIVQNARQFPAAAAQQKCEQSVTLLPVQVLPFGGEVSVNIHSEACRGQHNEVSTLEHVQVTVSMSAVCRGDISIELLSPAQTRSLLLGTCREDASPEGFRNWTMLSVQSWRESPHGTWTLTVKDHKGTVAGCGQSHTEEAAGAVLNVTLTLYGTYSPNRTHHEGSLSGFMALGKLHALPHRRNRFTPQDLIHWAFQLERASKVSPADIQVAPRRFKKPMVEYLSMPTFSSLDMDDTDGESLESYLHTLWNTLRGSAQVATAHNDALRQVEPLPED